MNPVLTPEEERLRSEVRAQFATFLDSKGYAEKVNKMIESAHTTLNVDLTDFADFNIDLAQSILLNYYRYEPFLSDALFYYINDRDPLYCQDERSRDKKKRFTVGFYNYDPELRMSIRSLRSHHVGRLVSVTGQVTRTSEVRPELLRGSFKCSVCGQVIENVNQNFQYTQPTACPSTLCNNTTRFDLIPSVATYADWQRVVVQELDSDVPPGSLPRTLEVILRNDLTDSVKPGDKVVFVGYSVAVPQTAPKGTIGVPVILSKPAGLEADGIVGVRSYGTRQLNFRTSFVAVSARGIDMSDDEESTQGIDMIVNARNDHDFYDKLSRSIAPNIYGHEDAKRGILLMLLGGVQKVKNDGLTMRGDINILLVGDPSTAKSQFLKFIARVIPRSVYTSGQSSSSAGLTASVTKDVETNEYTIEAGAMMLADRGICCIDEFDKMNLTDQTAIHEAMEQQTISIAKAGIQATLCAKTSVLAAANPIGGRYDRSRSLRANLNFSDPIMSRFDLFFIIVDHLDPEMDQKIARHIINVHKIDCKDFQEQQQLEQVEAEATDRFPQDVLIKYILRARKFQPQITEAAALELKEQYCRMRANDSGARRTSYQTTVRQLESLIRLSEAIAKMRLDPYIQVEYVQEAGRLLNETIIQVESDPVVINIVKAAEQLPEEQITITGDEFLKYTQAIIGAMGLLGGKAEATGIIKQILDGQQMPEDVAREKVKIITAIIERMSNQEHQLIADEGEDGKVVYQLLDQGDL